MSNPFSDRLEKQSLMLMAAAMVGHAGNYAYHFITGRMLPEAEYGLLMALFGAVNLVLLPMSALNVALARSIASLQAEGHSSAVASLMKTWFLRFSMLGTASVGLVWVCSPWLQPLFGVSRMAPLLLAASIPALNLLLTLTGAGLQGLQLFKGLALRGSLLFLIRALVVGACLTFGFAAAGWGLLAHLVGMGVALALSCWFLSKEVKPSQPSAPFPPILRGSLLAFPVLLAFSALMTADVVLVRAMESEVISGQFAQAATLGRMILWLPLPIAQVMFPKVVGSGAPTVAQRSTLRKAMLYTVLLVGCTLVGAWVLGGVLFSLLFGHPPTPQQLSWFRGIAGCMALLGPVYVVIQYELARGRISKLLPVCALALVYVVSAWFRSATPDELIKFLGVAALLALVSSMRTLLGDNISVS